MRILVAGIGNIFFGDDAFGVEVARRLLQREQPDGVRVVDFGIRSFDLVYALLDGYDVVIFVDATPRGGEPGTVYVIEPDLSEIEDQPAEMEAHAMNPMRVLRMAKDMGGALGKILLIGCEPETLGPEEGMLGLSATVESAVERSIGIVESLVAELLNDEARAANVGEYVQREAV
jgi:hydrogenase maturation protease